MKVFLRTESNKLWLDKKQTCNKMNELNWMRRFKEKPQKKLSFELHCE